MSRNLLTVVMQMVVALLASASFGEVRSQSRWPEDIVDQVARLPVQDDGRVKPLMTVARFRLIRFVGKSYMKLMGPGDEEYKLPATEWLLDCLFFPERARSYPTFLISRYEVIDEVGLRHGKKKKRDRWSFEELESGIDKLFELGRKYEDIPSKKRTSVQEQVYRLALNVSDFNRLIHYLDPVKAPLSLAGAKEAQALYGGRDSVPLHEVLAKGAELRAMFLKAGGAAEQHGKETPLGEVLARLFDWGNRRQALAMFPPPVDAPASERWLTLGDLILGSLKGDDAPKGLDTQYAQIARLERMVAARENPEAFRKELTGVQTDLSGVADARGQYAKVETEVAFYKGKYLEYAQHFYVLAFFLVALLWFFPNNRIAAWVATIGVLIPTAYLIVGITMRCIIRSRPPISTLYETILFITAVIAIVMLLVELINRQRIALSVAAFLGAAGMYLANRFEMTERVDTMPTLVAVLDTNFWLATHVTSIVTGYAASLLAAALAHVWLIGKGAVYLHGRLKGVEAAKLRNRGGAFFRNVGRMTYGAVAFGLVFSVVGTILGGIWANDSWGRFWGWDPKENGALMICLWQLVILHSRIGGYVRHFGISMLCLVLGAITAFSWWHVNNLGEGLHSYGFTEGVVRNLFIFYGSQVGLLLIASVAWFFGRTRTATQPAMAGDSAVAVQAPEQG